VRLLGLRGDGQNSKLQFGD